MIAFRGLSRGPTLPNLIRAAVCISSRHQGSGRSLIGRMRRAGQSITIRACFTAARLLLAAARLLLRAGLLRWEDARLAWRWSLLLTKTAMRLWRRDRLPTRL
jgi:hypothetical protein